MKSQKRLQNELSEAIQKAGTLKVLHTNAVASRIGLSATEFEAMDIITRYQPMTAGKLAEYCGLTTGAITGLVDRLERAGFVMRERDSEDRRRVYIKPIENEERSKKVRELYMPIANAFHSLATQYTPEQTQLLINLHTQLNDVTEKAISELRKIG